MFDDLRMNGTNIRGIRKHIGSVLQTSKFYSGTILTNIDPTESLSMEEVYQLATFVGLNNDLSRMPMGAIHIG